MPYIQQRERSQFDMIVGQFPQLTSGQLNYAITQLLLDQFPESYEDYNRLIGVLECCKLEFYRRAVAAYEDEKIKENGDVY